jgi:hypothetical protein
MTGTPFANYSDCPEDGSQSVQSCVQISYATYQCSGTTMCGVITASTTTYYVKDRSTSVLIQGKWIEGASGRVYRGPGNYLSGTHDFGWHSVTSGHAYTYPGAWSTSWSVLARAAGGQRGGQSTLIWDYRGRQQTFSLSEVLNDSGSGGSER